MNRGNHVVISVLSLLLSASNETEISHGRVSWQAR
jgi:hypothetical protein